jgi:hypothetical protein
MTDFVADGTEKTVMIYGKILSSGFGLVTAGAYSTPVTLSVNY